MTRFDTPSEKNFTDATAARPTVQRQFRGLGIYAIGVVIALTGCAPSEPVKPSAPGTTSHPTEPPTAATEVLTDDSGTDPEPETQDRGPRTVTNLTVDGTERGLEQTQLLPIASATCGDFRSAGVTAVDFDGDGANDLAAPQCDKVYLWRGRGDGTFEAPRILTIGDDPAALAYGVWFWDFDRDGLPEMLFPSTGSLKVLANLGHGDFEEGPRWGIPDNAVQPATINFTDLNGDGRADMFVGNTSVNIVEMLQTRAFVRLPEMDDELYLQSATGDFSALAVPGERSWFTLHSVPFEGGVLAFSDFASTSGGSAWYCVEGDRVQAQDSLTWINHIEAPMGGMLDWFEGEERLLVSDSQPVHGFVRDGDQWFERAEMRDVFPSAYSWSVLRLERLRDEATIAVTYGGFPADIQTRNPQARADSVRLFDTMDGAYEQEILIDQGSFIGATAADFNGDGLPELVGREMMEDHASALRVWSARSPEPRVLLQPDVTCLDATVSTSGRKAAFLPYTNAGSFGHGPLELTLPWPADGLMTIEAHGHTQVITVEPNTRVPVSCSVP